VAVVAFAVSFLTALGYVSLMYPGHHRLEGVLGVGAMLFPFSILYSVWAAYRYVSRRDLRGGWMVWAACGLLFLATVDFVRHLLDGSGP